MKKNLKKMMVALATFCGVILAMAVIFNACKKDEDKAKINKSKVETAFDVNALYTAHQDGNSGAGWRNIGADENFLNGGGHVYDRWVATGGVEYKSFCAGNLSTGIAGDGGSGQNCSQYKVQQVYRIGDGYDNLISALNYVNNTYGSIDSWTEYYVVENSTRLLSQVLVWNLYCGVPIEEMTVNSTALSKMEYYVTPIMAALNSNAKGEITGFAYLVCTNDHDGDHAHSCQPQLVPLYDEPTTYDECEDVNLTFSSAMYTFGTEFKTFKKGTSWNPDGNSNNVNQCMLMPGYSSWHTIYNFYVKDQYENEFFSFCASWGSNGEGFVSEKNPNFTGKQFDDIKGVLNYIYNKYGSLDAWGVVQGTGRITNDIPAENTKIVAQIAIWSILGQDVTVDISGHAMPKIMAAVQEALTYGKNASGIIGIYYLGGDDYPGDIMSNQPQIVPVCEECEVNFHSLSFWGEEHGLVDFFGHLYEHHDAYQNDLTPALFRLFEEWYVFDGHTGDGKGHWVDPSCCHFPDMNCDLWDKLADVLTSVETEGGNNWEYDNGTNEYYLWLKKIVADEIKKLTCVEIKVVSGLNWNNGNTSNGNGANGAGLIQFTVDGFTFKNNKNYVTPANFAAAIATNNKPSNTDIYTVTERATSKLGDKKADKYTAPITGKYTKIYYVQVAMYRNGEWKIYEGTITVDNPGGNNDKQKVDIFRIY